MKRVYTYDATDGPWPEAMKRSLAIYDLNNVPCVTAVDGLYATERIVSEYDNGEVYFVFADRPGKPPAKSFGA
jgi:hypothetical protein